MSLSSFDGAGHQRRLADAIALLGCGLLIAIYVPVLLARWRQAQTLQDFSAFWTAGRMALAGKAAAAYDWASLNDQLYGLFGNPQSPWVRTFYYPPIYFLVVAPLAMLPFAAAAAVWIVANLGVYLAGMRAILRERGALVIALAAPVVLLNLSAGQNGLLAAGLLAAALAIIDTRPIASGVLIGLLVCKPHFGLLLPPFLAITGRWRVMTSAAATALLLIVVAGLCFGFSLYGAFARALPTAVDGYLEHARMTRALPWGELQSVYGTLRALGLGNAAAWWAHAAVAAAAAAASLRIAVGSAGLGVKAAALATASFIVTPYSELNDVALLMVPWALLLHPPSRPPPAEQLVLSLIMLAPMLYLIGRLLLRAGGLPQLATWTGMGPVMCVLLAAAIGARLRPASL